MREDIKVKVTQALTEAGVASDYAVTRVRMRSVAIGDFLAYVEKDGSVDFFEVEDVATNGDAVTLVLEGGGLRSGMGYIPVDVAKPRR